MIFYQFFFGFIIYSAMAFGTYHEGYKASNYYFPLGILMAIGANFIWLSIARTTESSSALVLRGLYWDVMLTACYLIVPFLFFGAKVNSTQAIGIGMVILGIILTKVG